MSNRIKRFHMYAGVDLVGSQMSMAESRNVMLEATSIGIRMTSAKTNRVVVIPYSNVKGFEVYPEGMEPKTAVSLPNAVIESPEAPKRRGRPPVKNE